MRERHSHRLPLLMHALDISALTKTYKNGTQALRGIDLCVREGEFFALLGPNGAGKSTTIGIVSSLINKTSGRVQVYGVDMDTNLEEAKSFIGLVPQEINFSQFESVIDIVVNQAGYYGVIIRNNDEVLCFYPDAKVVLSVRDPERFPVA